jgi:hypothetical protein
MEKDCKNFLSQGLGHLDVAERMKCPLILTWAMALRGIKDSARLDQLKIPIQLKERSTIWL